MKTPAIILFTLALAVPATWFATRHSPRAGEIARAAIEQRILYYQSVMHPWCHPWVKSDKPGRCTICGMALTPVCEGDMGMEAGADVVSLDQSMVQVLHVQTATAQKRPLAKTLTFASIVDHDAWRHRIVSAYVDGRVEKLYVNHHGATVVEGKPLGRDLQSDAAPSGARVSGDSGELRHPQRGAAPAANGTHACADRGTAGRSRQTR